MWKMQLTLTDSKLRSTRLEFILGNFGLIVGDPFEFGPVLNAGNSIYIALNELTDCEISQVVYSYTFDLSAQYPVSGTADVTDEAYFSLALDSLIPGTANHRIPAPVQALLSPDHVGLVTDLPDFEFYLDRLQTRSRYGPNGDVEIADPIEIRNNYWRSVFRKSK